MKIFFRKNSCVRFRHVWYLSLILLVSSTQLFASSVAKKINVKKTYVLENQGYFLGTVKSPSSTLSDSALVMTLSKKESGTHKILFEKAEEPDDYFIKSCESDYIYVRNPDSGSENPLYHHFRKGQNATFHLELKKKGLRIKYGPKFLAAVDGKIKLLSSGDSGFNDKNIHWKLKNSKFRPLSYVSGRVHYAALHGDLQTLRSYQHLFKILEEYDPVYRSNFQSAIVYGIKSMNPDVVEFLFKSGSQKIPYVSPEGYDEIGMAILCKEEGVSIPTESQRLDVIEKIIQSGVYFYKLPDQKGRLALHYAVIEGYADIVSYLISSGYAEKIDAKDQFGKSARDYALEGLESARVGNDIEGQSVYDQIIRDLDLVNPQGFREEIDSVDSESDSDLEDLDAPLAEALKSFDEASMTQGNQMLTAYPLRVDRIAYYIKNTLGMNLEKFNPVEDYSSTSDHFYLYTDPDGKKWFTKFREGTQSFKREYDALKKIYETDAFVSRPIAVKYFPEVNMIMKEMVPGSETLRDYLKGRSRDRSAKLVLDEQKIDKLKALFEKLFEARILLSDINLGNIIYSTTWNDWYVIDTNGMSRPESPVLTALFYLQERYGRYLVNRQRSELNGSAWRNKDFYAKQHKLLLMPVFGEYVKKESPDVFYKFFAQSPVGLSIKDPETLITYYLNQDSDGFLTLTDRKQEQSGFVFQNKNTEFDRQDCLCLVDEMGASLSMRSKRPAFCGGFAVSNMAFLGLKEQRDGTYGIEVRARGEYLKADFKNKIVSYDGDTADGLSAEHKFTISLLHDIDLLDQIDSAIEEASALVGPRLKNKKLLVQSYPALISGDRFQERYFKISDNKLSTTLLRNEAALLFFDPVKSESGGVTYRIKDASGYFLRFKEGVPEFTRFQELADLFTIKQFPRTTRPFYGKYSIVNVSQGKKFLTLRYDLDGKVELCDKTDSQLLNMGQEELVGTWEAFDIRYIGENLDSDSLVL